jgi:hypothetical protein
MCLVMQLAENGSLHNQLYGQYSGNTAREPVLALDAGTGRLQYPEVGMTPASLPHVMLF